MLAAEVWADDGELLSSAEQYTEMHTLAGLMLSDHELVHVLLTRYDNGRSGADGDSMTSASRRLAAYQCELAEKGVLFVTIPGMHPDALAAPLPDLLEAHTLRVSATSDITHAFTAEQLAFREVSE